MKISQQILERLPRYSSNKYFYAVLSDIEDS